MLWMNLELFLYMTSTLVLSISIHEFSHAYALYCLGDSSLRTRRRLTLRPDVHFKWWGYLILLLTGLIVGNPVIIEFEELDERNEYLVLLIAKLAGPLSNLVTAIAVFFVVKYMREYPLGDARGIVAVAKWMVYFAYANAFLFVFNMIPIPILDGGVFILIIGMYFDIKDWVYLFSYISLIVFLVVVYKFPDNSIVEYIYGIPVQFMNLLFDKIIYI